MQAQIQLLRARVPSNRIILPPEDRQRLLQLGVAIDHHVDDLIGIVSVKTYKRWLREQRARISTPATAGVFCGNEDL